MDCTLKSSIPKQQSCMHIDGTTIQILQIEIFSNHDTNSADGNIFKPRYKSWRWKNFMHFQACLCPQLGSLWKVNNYAVNWTTHSEVLIMLCAVGYLGRSWCIGAVWMWQ